MFVTVHIYPVNPEKSGLVAFDSAYVSHFGATEKTKKGCATGFLPQQ